MKYSHISFVQYLDKTQYLPKTFREALGLRNINLKIEI